MVSFALKSENTETTRLFLYSAEPESEIAINSTYLNSTFATLPDYLHHWAKIIAFLILNSWIYKFSRRKKNRKNNTGIFVGIYDLTQLLDVWIFPPLPFFVSWCIIRLPCTNFEVCMKLFKNWKTGSFPAESPNNPSKWKLFTMKTWIKEGSLRNSIHFYVTPSDKVKKAKCVRCFCDLL